MNPAIRHVLLDIEGTTCPVTFVSDTLFPYAAARMEAFLEARQGNSTVQNLLGDLNQAWLADLDPAARALLDAAPATAKPSERILPYLHWLMREDRKLTPLKDLQGLIWEEGYASGDLQGPLFPDVAPALRRWRDAGIRLAVYSSGSVQAQQLIYGHSNAGDLRPLFQHWFDTKIGSKHEAKSYQRIVAQLMAEPQSVLFISDSLAEVQAANTSGLAVLLCNRSGSGDDPPNGDGGFAIIRCFEGL